MATVTVHALDAGHITLPERFFVMPHDPKASKYVPSLSFLVQHTAAVTNKITRILFDLGLRRDLNLYPSTLKAHCESRSPISTRPDVVESLAQGGLTPDDIDYIILSHVHYDHIGYPKDFANPKTKFIIGPGARSVLSGGVTFHGSHSVFESDLLPPARSIELPPVEASFDYQHDTEISETPLHLSQWTPLAPFNHVLDIFGDSTVYIVNAPGHLPGHINLLCRTTPSSPSPSSAAPPGHDEKQSSSTSASTESNTTTTEEQLTYVLLAGDSCHDDRLLQGTHSIATWHDQSDGKTCCIHADLATAEQTITTLRQVHEHGIQIVNNDTSSSSNAGATSSTGTGKFMKIGDQTIEIQKGWFGDPRAQDPGRMDPVPPPSSSSSLSRDVKTKPAKVEVVFAHDDVWEKNAKDRGRFWPGQL